MSKKTGQAAVKAGYSWGKKLPHVSSRCRVTVTRPHRHVVRIALPGQGAVVVTNDQAVEIAGAIMQQVVNNVVRVRCIKRVEDE